MLTAVLRTSRPTMTIKDCIVSHLDFVVEVYQLLDVLVFVFHVVALADVTNNPSIKPFHYKFKCANPECISWLQIVMLLGLQHFVKATGLLRVHVQIA